MLGAVILGETILSLKKTMAKLTKEGQIEIPKTWVQLSNPAKDNEPAGGVLM